LERWFLGKNGSEVSTVDCFVDFNINNYGQ